MSEESEISETRVQGRHYSASIQLKAFGSVSTMNENMTSRHASIAARFIARNEPNYDEHNAPDTRLLESINNVLALAYDINII